MKYMTRTNIYQCSNYNCTFNPTTLEAFSYCWWKFVAVVEGKVVFNSYRYSNSTSKHQSKVRSLMRELGIKIDLELGLPQGINSSDLQTLFVTAEETLCDQFLHAELKREERLERARMKRAQEREKEKQREEQRPHISLDGGQVYEEASSNEQA